MKWYSNKTIQGILLIMTRNEGMQMVSEFESLYATNYGTLDLKMMNSAFESNYKIIVKTFRIILETLRRRV